MEPQAPRQVNARPFTVIEVLVVLFLIAAVAGIALPRLQLVPAGVQRRGTVNAIADAFRNAGSLAMATGQQVEVRLDFAADAIRLTPRGPARELEQPDDPMGPDDPDLPPMAHPLFQDMLQVSLDASIELDEMRSFDLDPDLDQTYRFYANGEADGPSLPIRIAGVPFTVDVDRLTGRPTILEKEEF